MKKNTLRILMALCLVVVMVPAANAILDGGAACTSAEEGGWSNPVFNYWCMLELMEDWDPDGEGPNGSWWGPLD